MFGATVQYSTVQYYTALELQLRLGNDADRARNSSSRYHVTSLRQAGRQAGRLAHSVRPSSSLVDMHMRAWDGLTASSSSSAGQHGASSLDWAGGVRPS